MAGSGAMTMPVGSEFQASGKVMSESAAFLDLSEVLNKLFSREQVLEQNRYVWKDW